MKERSENESVTSLMGMLMLRSSRGEGRSLGGTTDKVIKSWARNGKSGPNNFIQVNVLPSLAHCLKAAHIDALSTSDFASPIYMSFLTHRDCITGTTSERRRHRPDRTVTKNGITPRSGILHRYQDLPHEIDTDKWLACCYLGMGFSSGIACVSGHYTIEKPERPRREQLR